jgi:DNA-binding transcriptional LysR family regulator
MYVFDFRQAHPQTSLQKVNPKGKVPTLVRYDGSRRRPKPKNPQDLTAHDCVNIRLPTYGGIYAWEFEKRGRALKVRVEGQLVFNNIALRVNAALAGLGLAYLTEDQVQEHVAKGRLVRVLGDWCPPFSGYHLYYPSRRQAAPAFALLVEALRYRSSRH